MRKISESILLTVITGFLILITSCEQHNDVIDQSPDPGEPVYIPLETYQKGVIDSANNFAFDLFKTILNDSKSMENIIISPFSVSCALSMTLNGARGETYEAMIKTLRVEDKTLEQINNTYLKLLNEMVMVDESVELEIFNSVWLEKRLVPKQEFIDDLLKWYKTEVLNIDIDDPEALNKVNAWIADKTQDKITDMLDYLNPLLAMLLINAVYFNGMWTYQFDIANTEQESFYIDSLTPVTVQMMHQTAGFKALKDKNVTITDIPYGRGNYSMLVVLPGEDINISDVSDSLTSLRWNNWMNLLAGATTHNIELSMPRFKYSYKRLLNDDLEFLGMEKAFDVSSDFSNINTGEKIYLSRVIHQSFIESGEEGTEAAAATVVEFIFKSGGPPPINKVEINRPFLYFIHENSTGTILFMGRVCNPASKQ
jgi:serine protease inhibitor